MKEKQEIARNWLVRYTGMPLDQFGDYILLCNFSNYIELFSKQHNNAPIYGIGKAMQACTAVNSEDIKKSITIINFGMGSPNAATILDLLSAINPKACLFLGKCGSLKEHHAIGDLILPIAGIRGEGTSDAYLYPEVPALPSFALQKAVSTTIRDEQLDYWTGTVFTTNKRLWEHDEAFKDYLRKIRAMAIDMETATLFSVAFANEIPIGALLLVSDSPMTPDGVKTEASDALVTSNFVEQHVELGIKSLNQIIFNNLTVKHLRF